jgi:hypothetical protein
VVRVVDVPVPEEKRLRVAAQDDLRPVFADLPDQPFRSAMVGSSSQSPFPKNTTRSAPRIRAASRSSRSRTRARLFLVYFVSCVPTSPW